MSLEIDYEGGWILEDGKRIFWWTDSGAAFASDPLKKDYSVAATLRQLRHFYSLPQWIEAAIKLAVDMHDLDWVMPIVYVDRFYVESRTGNIIAELQYRRTPMPSYNGISVECMQSRLNTRRGYHGSDYVNVHGYGDTFLAPLIKQYLDKL